MGLRGHRSPPPAPTTEAAAGPGGGGGGGIRVHFSRREFHMQSALNEVFLENFFKDGVTFRDESNDGN